jgi:hypothetical protein
MNLSDVGYQRQCLATGFVAEGVDETDASSKLAQVAFQTIRELEAELPVPE